MNSSHHQQQQQQHEVPGISSVEIDNHITSNEDEGEVKPQLQEEFVHADEHHSHLVEVEGEIIEHVVTLPSNQHGLVVEMMTPQQGEDEPSILRQQLFSQDQLHGEHITQTYISAGSQIEGPSHYENAGAVAEELLSRHDLTDEDRRLAAALVAVQLVQQQKQQQLVSNSSVVSSDAHEANNIMMSAAGLTTLITSPSNLISVSKTEIMSTDVGEEEYEHQQQHITLNTNNDINILRKHTVNEQLHKNAVLPPLKRVLSSHSGMLARFRNTDNKAEIHANMDSRKEPVTVIYPPNENIIVVTPGKDPTEDEEVLEEEESEDELLLEEAEKCGEEESELDDGAREDTNDSDYDESEKPPKRNLPHKKRISRRLKNPRNSKKKVSRIHAKCYKCNKCGEQFQSQQNYSDHKMMHASSPVSSTPSTSPSKKELLLFHCELCKQGFTNQLRFFEHLKAHYEPPKSSAPTPKAIMKKEAPPIVAIPTSVSTVNAVPVEMRSPQRMVEIVSNIKNENEIPGALHDEISTITIEPKDMFQCHCGKTFKRQKAYETHVMTAHPIEAGLVDGSGIGDDTVITEDWMPEEGMTGQVTAEMLTQETAEPLDHLCEMCGEGFDTRAQLNYHIRVEHPEMRKRIRRITPGPRRSAENLSCRTCGRTFNHRNSLVYHLRSHTGERPHQCEVCGKSFFAASALKVHMRLHSGDKPYKCEHCERHFRQWGDLKYHCISIHSDEKQYQCEYCGKDFARKYSLIVHRRIHTGEKNYKCEFCGKTFRASSYLQNHRRIHTGEKPHPCEICGKPFRVRSDMKRHMQTHNRDGHSHVVHSSQHAPQVNSGGGLSHGINATAAAVHSITPSGQDTMTELNPVAAEITIQDTSESILPDEALSQPINLNIAVPSRGLVQSHHHVQQMTPQAVQEEVLHYSRDTLEVRDSGSNTLYVWPIYMT